MLFVQAGNVLNNFFSYLLLVITCNTIEKPIGFVYFKVAIVGLITDQGLS